MYIDTHAHLFMKEFGPDLPAVIKRAREAGVEKIIDVGIDMETCRAAVENAERHEGVFAAAGFHPHVASEYDAGEFESFVRENREKIVALGEFGLDFYRNLSPPEKQKEAFVRQLEFGLSEGLPLIFHCRAAHREMLDILSSYKRAIRGVMHCFSGGRDELRKTLDIGLHVAVDGPVTYPKSKLPEIVRHVPRGRLLLETDCPYLAPQQFRGKRNEPRYIPLIAGAVADALGVKIWQVRERTTANAMELFGLASTHHAPRATH
ncbi:MAG: TatD family hydrolase [bacterium]